MTNPHQSCSAGSETVFPYQQTFDAIVAAVSLWPDRHDASGISISVRKFQEAFNSHRDAGTFDQSINVAQSEKVPVVWAAFTERGYVRFWTTDETQAAGSGLDVKPCTVDDLMRMVVRASAAQPPAAPVEDKRTLTETVADIRKMVAEHGGLMHEAEEVEIPGFTIDALSKQASRLHPADQHKLAEMIAANVGYELMPEPPHPDCPHERSSAGNADAIRQQLNDGNRMAKEASQRRQYYYRMNGCNATHSGAPDCVCWHDEGTGPYADRSDAPVTWRTINEPQQPASAPLMDAGSIFTFLRERMEDETSASLAVACRALADHLRVLRAEPQGAPDIAAGMTKAMEIVGNMRQSEAGLFDAKHSGQRGEDRSNALYDAYVAIRSAMTRPQSGPAA